MLTSLDFLNPKSKWTPGDSDVQKQLETIERNKQLYDGDYAQAFKEVWESIQTRIDKDSQVEQIMVVINLFPVLVDVYLDLVLEKEPIFTTEERNQEKLDKFLIVSNFVNNALEKTFIDAYSFGDGILQVSRIDNEVQISAVTPDLWFPVIDRGNKNKVLAHVIAYEYTEKSTGIFGDTIEKKYINVQIHEKGSVTYKTLQIEGDIISSILEEKTLNIDGWDDFLIFPYNFGTPSWHVYGKDGFSDIVSIIEEIIVRISNNSKILDDHASPILAVPEGSMEHDPYTEVKKFKKADVYEVDKEDIKPEYITWDGNLDHSFKQIELMMDYFYMLTGTSPQMFGKDMAGNLSGAALEKVFTRAISKAKRMAKNQKLAACKALKCAMALQGVKLDVSAKYTVGDFQDIQEIIERTVLQHRERIMSTKAAIQAVNPDYTEEQVEEEMQLISDNSEANAVKELENLGVEDD